MAKVRAASVVEAHSVMSEEEDPIKDASLSTDVAEVSAHIPFCQFCFWDQWLLTGAESTAEDSNLICYNKIC